MKPVTQQEILSALRSIEKWHDVGQLQEKRWALANRIKAHGIAPPEGMVIVPIEPTAEMVRAAEEAYMPFGDMGMALICGNLAAPKQENSNE